MDNELTEPDLNPMLDVIFILLIFFVVTATFVKETGIDVPGENQSKTESTSSDALILDISREDRYVIKRSNVDRRALEFQLARFHAESPERPLLIRASKKSSTDALVYALDVANLAGIRVLLSKSRE